MKIDFTGVEGQKGFTPVPAGKYLIEVTDYRQGTASENAKNAGAPTISWEFTIQSTVGGEEVITDRTGEEVKVADRKVWENMTIVENSFWRLKAFLEACGFDVSGEIDFDPDEVVGSTLIAKVGVQPARKNKDTGDEYEARNAVKAFFAIEGSE